MPSARAIEGSRGYSAPRRMPVIQQHAGIGVRTQNRGMPVIQQHPGVGVRSIRQSAPRQQQAPRISSNPTGQMSTTTVQPAAVAPPPMPAIPTEEDFLGGDTTFLSQQAALKAALENYMSQMGQQKSQYGTDYAAKVDQLGFDLNDPSNPKGLFKRSIGDQENDFASRGLLQSGLFGNARDELTSDFQTRANDMLRARTQFETGLDTDLTNFKSEQGLTLDRARADALARRAAQFAL